MIKVAALQMISTPVVQENLDIAAQLLKEAQSQGAELAVLPEYFCLMGHRDKDKLSIQEPIGHGPIQEFLSHQAKTLGLWIVAGTIPVSTQASTSSDTVFNATLVYNPKGECVCRYDKIHLFQFQTEKEHYDESATLKPGQSPSFFDVTSGSGETWRFGLSICYDLRFAELYRHYASHRVDVMLVPAAFTFTTGEAHWEILLKARAIENLAYVVASAQGGEHLNGRKTFGHSMVVDPWGKTLSSMGLGQGVVMAELNRTLMKERREQLPALNHRRL
jgi:nitrilase